MIRPLIVLAALVLAVPASARDDRNLYPLDDALKSPNAQAKLDSGVALYFAGQKHPGVDERLDDGTTDIDTLDAFEYTIERDYRRLTAR